MLSLVVWAQSAATDLATAFWWEIVKGFLLFTITGLAGVVAKAVVAMRDDIRDVKRDIRGVDGTNGLKSEMRAVVDRVDLIDDRFVAMDAVAEASRMSYDGEERRHDMRRGEDVLTSLIAKEITRALKQREKQ